MSRADYLGKQFFKIAQLTNSSIWYKNTFLSPKAASGYSSQLPRTRQLWGGPSRRPRGAGARFLRAAPGTSARPADRCPGALHKPLRAPWQRFSHKRALASPGAAPTPSAPSPRAEEQAPGTSRREDRRARRTLLRSVKNLLLPNLSKTQ